EGCASRLDSEPPCTLRPSPSDSRRASSRESSPRTTACPASQTRSSPAIDPDPRDSMESRCKESRPFSELTSPPEASPALTSLPRTALQRQSCLRGPRRNRFHPRPEPKNSDAEN